MWQSIEAQWRDRTHGAAFDDLFAPAVDGLMAASIGIPIAFYLLIAASPWWALAPLMFPVIFILIVCTACALRVLPERALLAQAIWLAGLSLAAIAGLVLSQQPAMAFLLCLVPLLAALGMGPLVGLFAEAFVAALVATIHFGQVAPNIAASTYVAVAVGGGLCWIIGWSITGAMLSLSSWTHDVYEQKRRDLEEARTQRLELKQIQEDLIQANHSMARMADRLRVVNQMAEQARRTKEEFVANVSHELRTPLNLVIGFVEMITQTPHLYGETLPVALMADLTVIERNARHLAGLIDDVLDLSQVDAGQMALSKEWVSLPDLVEEAVLAVRPLFESRGLYLHVDFPPGLPSVFCDSTRVRQVTLNLLSNAGRFTASGGVTVRVVREAGNIVVSVTDTGPGISETDQAKLFEPFEQTDSSIRRKYGGTGLGLAISKRFVEMHGGRMWLDSKLTVGTTFYVSLPILPEPADAAGSPPALRWFRGSQQYEERSRRSLAPPLVVRNRVIVCEHSDVLQRILRRHADDLEIVVVGSMAEVRQALAKDTAQAVLVNAPDTDKPERQARDLPRLTPLIHCWLPGTAEATRRLGVASYLTKPVGRDGLLAAMKEVSESAQTILVADDDADLHQLIERMLSSAGLRCRVLHATNGRQTLSILRSHRPDLVLLDLMMPGVDGYQVLREKKLDSAIRDIPVIVLSARDPVDEHVTGETLTITRQGGLTVQELLVCLRGLAMTLSGSPATSDPGRPETTGV